MFGLRIYVPYSHTHDSTSPPNHGPTPSPLVVTDCFYLDPAHGFGSLCAKTVLIEKALGGPKILRFFPGMCAFLKVG